MEFFEDSSSSLYDYLGKTGTLPSEVQKWAGLLDEDRGLTKSKHFSDTLTEKNDSGFSFSEIADVIEKHL